MRSLSRWPTRPTVSQTSWIRVVDLIFDRTISITTLPPNAPHQNSPLPKATFGTPGIATTSLAFTGQRNICQYHTLWRSHRQTLQGTTMATPMLPPSATDIVPTRRHENSDTTISVKTTLSQNVAVATTKSRKERPRILPVTKLASHISQLAVYSLGGFGRCLTLKERVAAHRRSRIWDFLELTTYLFEMDNSHPTNINIK
jgi:hypothetical protein